MNHELFRVISAHHGLHKFVTTTKKGETDKEFELNIQIFIGEEVFTVYTQKNDLRILLKDDFLSREVNLSQLEKLMDEITEKEMIKHSQKITKNK